MRRMSILLAALAMLMFGVTTSAQAVITTTINPRRGPDGHASSEGNDRL
jgi:hypothetical protein